MSSDANYTRSLRDEIKAKQKELKDLREKARAERAAKKASRGAPSYLLLQVRFILAEAPGQAETASQLLQGLFAKRELTEEFKAYADLQDEKRAAKKAGKKAAAEAVPAE